MKLETAGLFLLALLPRLWGMRRLITVDEAYWLRQTLLFWQALTARQWADAGIAPEPGLTTLWGGGLGLWGYRLAVSTLSLTDWLALFRPLPVRLELLQAARLPLILLTCAGIGILYRLMRPCLGLPAARLAAGLLAFEPFFVAQSRLLTNEAPAALLALITLLTLWRAAQGSEWALVGAGVSAGLAVAADWTAVLLIPFAAAVFGVAGPKEGPLWRRLAGPVERFAFWLLLAGVVLVALWPAALLQPSNILRAVAGRPFGLGERQQALELLFRLAPVSMIGLALWPVYRSRLPGRTRAATHLLALFSAAFLLLIVVAGPRVEGRVLPALLPLTVVAAAGWQGWLDGRSRRVRSLGPGVLVAAQLLILLPFAPYFVTFANPLLGGPPVAARVVGVGRGEGMDRVAAWLNSQPETLAGTVGSDFPDTLAPYFAGRIANTGAPNLAFVVLYINRDGGEFPSQAALRYYNLLAEPAHTVRLAGLDYARIYHGPAVQPAMPLPVGMETGLLPRPLAFRPAADGPAPGDSLTVDVIWLANPDMPDTQSTLSLRDPVKFQAGLNGDDRPVALPGAIYAQAQAPLRRAAENLIVSRHTLRLPLQLAPGRYGLMVDGRPLGNIVVARKT